MMLPLFIPVYGRVVHFVDEDNEMLNAGSFNQHGMLSCLAAFLKSRLKLTLARGNNLKT